MLSCQQKEIVVIIPKNLTREQRLEVVAELLASFSVKDLESLFEARKQSDRRTGRTYRELYKMIAYALEMKWSCNILFITPSSQIANYIFKYQFLDTAKPIVKDISTSSTSVTLHNDVTISFMGADNICMKSRQYQKIFYDHTVSEYGIDTNQFNVIDGSFPTFML